MGNSHNSSAQFVRRKHIQPAQGPVERRVSTISLTKLTGIDHKFNVFEVQIIYAAQDLPIFLRGLLLFGVGRSDVEMLIEIKSWHAVIQQGWWLQWVGAVEVVILRGERRPSSTMLIVHTQ